MFWKVIHQAYHTDGIINISDIVSAPNKEAALLKYNTLAARRLGYPYMWNLVGPDAIFHIEIIE